MSELTWTPGSRVACRLAVASLLLVFAFVAGPPASALECRSPQREMIAIELFFGRNVKGRFSVSEKRWTDFLAREITPRFPDGLTVFDGVGQWRDQKRNRIARELSKVVKIVAPQRPLLQEHVAEIAGAYKHRFRQQSVGVTMAAVCASF